jgi:hypothetical protein
LWLSFTSHSHIIWNVSAMLASLIWFRLLALVVVRTSIQMSVQTCLDAIRQHDGKLILIGFSWGGAVGFRKRKRGNCYATNLTIAVSAPYRIRLGSRGTLGHPKDWRSTIDLVDCSHHVFGGIDCNGARCCFESGIHQCHGPCRPRDGGSCLLPESGTVDY